MEYQPAGPRITDLTRDEQRLGYAYVRFRDVDLAADAIRMNRSYARKLWRENKVAAWCDERIARQDGEAAKLAAMAGTLTLDLLDVQLKKMVTDKNLEPKDRIKAVELGYRRVGVIRDQKFVVNAPSEKAADAPDIYAAPVFSESKPAASLPEPRIIEGERVTADDEVHAY